MDMNYFCHNAFNGLDISSDGQIRPCCKFLTTNIPKFHITEGIDTYKNSKWLKDLQNQFIAGEKPTGCARCWREEEAGIQSKRQLDYQRHQKIFDVVDLKNSNFINISLAFGNLCNLACRICNPGASSKWASEQKKIDGIKYPIHEWFKSDSIMEDIFSHTKNAVHIDIPGGEPLLIEINEHLEFLERFIKSKNADKNSLHYTTNGTTFPKENYQQIWKNFKFVDIQLSIDDIESRFEYNRWPARWDQVYSNIKRYQKLVKDNKNLRLSISHSISAFTILYANEFFKWCIREGLPAPWMGLISKPIYYSPSVLPNLVCKKISDILGKSRIKEVRKLKDYLQYDNSQYLDQFLSVTRKLDTIRNQNFQTTFPELAELIRHYI